MVPNSRTKTIHLLLAALLALPVAVLLSSTTAEAAGISPKTNNCYVQWWSTHWTARCDNALVSGKYRAHVARADQRDYYGPWRSVSRGSWSTFDSGSSWRGIQSRGNWVEFPGDETSLVV